MIDKHQQHTENLLYKMNNCNEYEEQTAVKMAVQVAMVFGSEMFREGYMQGYCDRGSNSFDRITASEKQGLPHTI